MFNSEQGFNKGQDNLYKKWLHLTLMSTPPTARWILCKRKNKNKCGLLSQGKEYYPAVQNTSNPI